MRFSHTLFLPALLAIAAPLAAILASACLDSSAWLAWSEAPRLLALLGNTLGLIAIASIIAVPLGTLAAFALERARIPGAAVLRAGVVIGLFVPLPVTAVAWQIILGSWLPNLALAPGEIAWQPWAQGLLPAGIVHGIAALPWVIAIVIVGLRSRDRNLEEDALVLGGPRMVIRRVLLPRAMLAALAAWGWVIVQTSTEIPITDAMMVRTLAEEVYTQIVGFPAGVRGAIVLTIPWLIVGGLGAMVFTAWLAKKFPHNPEPAGASRPLGSSRFATVFAYGLVGIVVVLPLLALAWKVLGGGTMPRLSPSFAGREFAKVLRTNGLVLAQSLATAVLAGLATAWLATALAWQARGSRWRTGLLFATAIVLALTPGPILGQGWKEMIQWLLLTEDRLDWGFAPLRASLYDRPSPLPTLIACILRWLPLALLIVAPAMRSLSRDLLEMAALDGANAWPTVGRPGTARATALAALACAGMSLGEVSASKLVAPPGYRLFILDLFDQMHYGAEPTVAALCLVQWALSGVMVLGGVALIPRRASYN